MYMIILLLYLWLWSNRHVSQCVCGFLQWTATQKYSKLLSQREKGKITIDLCTFHCYHINYCRLKVARTELDKMMAELKEKQDALEEVESKVCGFII